MSPGPITYLTSGRPMTPAERAVEVALSLWQEGIIDPTRADRSPRAVRSREVINAVFREGLGWKSWEKKGRLITTYEKDGDGAWCGAFAAYCWSKAGLDPDLRRHFASCWKLYNWSKYTGRRIAVQDVRAGDAVVMGDADPRWGDHIGLATTIPVSAGLPTVEGNGESHDPTGHPLGEGIEGIVQNLRPLSGRYRILYGVRVLEEDLG